MKKIVLGILIGLLALVIGGVVTARGIERNRAIVFPSAIEVEVPDQAIYNSPVLVNPGEFISDEIIVKFKGEKEFRVLKVPEGKVGEKIKEHLARKDVVYAEPNYIAYALLVPNDPYYSYQWHLDNSVYGGIQMQKAWDVSAGAGVTVAVVDTGIRKGTDLANTCFVPGLDYVNNDSDPIDDNGHGTHVAGTIAQSTDNGVGVASVAYKSCLMPVKVLNSTGSGTYAQVANGIYYAADNGAKVINLSLGGSSDSVTLKDAVAYAYNKGVTVVAAAGNDSSNVLSYPAAYDAYVIAVGATQYDETKAPYSNYGPSLDLVAPGGNTGLDQNNDGYADGVLQQTFTKTGRTISWAYYFFQGTSMAAPHISGVAALLIAKGNATTPGDIRTALQETAEDKGVAGRDDTYGYGLVDAYAALGWTAAPVIACSSDTECDDSNECTVDVCQNPGLTTAYCENTAVADNTTCDDGLFCTVSDVCTAGVCGGVTKDCSDGVACTVDSCDEVINVCVNNSNNALCNDGLYCNGAETCNATLGCQVGTPVNCNDGNECTTDSCNETTDGCGYVNLPDNTTCTGGVCCLGTCIAGTTGCPTAVKCWSGTNLYLYKATDQVQKFCKCAQGSYGYKSYKSNQSTKTVWKYIEPANNENWQVTSTSSKTPVYSVTCIDSKAYPTNVDYTYPK